MRNPMRRSEVAAIRSLGADHLRGALIRRIPFYATVR
jgi:hypothetical protein